MKKQSARQDKPLGRDEQVGHLEDTLTELTNTTAQRLKRWRTPLLTVVVLGILVWLVYNLADSFSESRDLQIAEREYQIFGSQAAQKEDYEPDSNLVPALLDDVAGKKEEKFVAKKAVDFYLEQSEQLTQKSKAQADSSAETKAPQAEAAGQSNSAPGKSELLAKAEKARDQALKIAEDTAKRHTDDMDIQSWALAVKAKIEGERNKSWLPPGRKYGLPPVPLPGAAPAQTPRVEGPATPPSSQKP